MAKKMHPLHKALVAKVRKVDREAANWLRDEMPKLPLAIVETTNLACAFTWVDSPQGHEYWDDIFEKVYGSRL